MSFFCFDLDRGRMSALLTASCGSCCCCCSFFCSIGRAVRRSTVDSGAVRTSNGAIDDGRCSPDWLLSRLWIYDDGRILGRQCVSFRFCCCCRFLCGIAPSAFDADWLGFEPVRCPNDRELLFAIRCCSLPLQSNRCLQD